jgi:hypothetical protein
MNFISRLPATIALFLRSINLCAQTAFQDGKTGKWGFNKEKQEKITKASYDAAENCINAGWWFDYAKVKCNGKWGIITTNEYRLFTITYDFCSGHHTKPPVTNMYI